MTNNFRGHNTPEEKADRLKRYHALRDVGLTRKDSIRCMDWRDTKIERVLKGEAMIFRREETMEIHKSNLVGGGDDYYLYSKNHKKQTEKNLFSSGNGYLYLAKSGMIKVPEELRGKKFRLKVEIVVFS
jgi:hypothetical protein